MNMNIFSLHKKYKDVRGYLGYVVLYLRMINEQDKKAKIYDNSIDRKTVQSFCDNTQNHKRSKERNCSCTVK